MTKSTTWETLVEEVMQKVAQLQQSKVAGRSFEIFVYIYSRIASSVTKAKIVSDVCKYCNVA